MSRNHPHAELPVIDVSSLVTGRGDPAEASRAVDAACREVGFFYAVGHGVPAASLGRLEHASRAFFARGTDEKMALCMERGGRAWRGYFPLGGELTSGRPDQKEGLYFGAELGDDHPRVRAGTPLHGRNLFPAPSGGDGAEALRGAVLGHLEAMTALGHALLEGMSRGLGLAPGHLREHYTGDPTVLLRIFHYPPLAPGRDDELWSVGEHTDYGLLTLLWQTGPGLEVRVGSRWVAAPPLPGALVCNLGDMLERMTGGLYRSTPHRVRNESGVGRLSFPFFFDPSWDALVLPIEGTPAATSDARSRWDGVDVHAFRGTYGEYLMGKVEKVFPALGRTWLPGAARRTPDPPGA